MALVLRGMLPVSVLNIGLVASIGTLSLQVQAISQDVAKLIALIPRQIQAHLFPPNPAQLAAGIAAQVAFLPTLLTPGVFAGASAVANIQAGLDLAAVTLLLETVGPAVGNMFSGLDAAGLMAWGYAGRAAGFGTQLANQTATGVGGQAADASVQGIVLATESPSAWKAFSSAFNTGGSASQAATSAREYLRYMGVLTGAELSFAVQGVKLDLDRFLNSLKALQSSLSAQIQVGLGVDLPDPGPLIAVLEAANPVDLVTAFFTVNVDLLKEAGLLTARINLILDQVASLSASLSGGGLSVWSYSGTVAGLGSELAGALAGGLPGGSGPDTPAYGMAIACAIPSAWASFGLIFGV